MEVIKPNLMKAFFSSFISLAVPGFAFLLLIAFIGNLIDFNIVGESLAFLGIIVNPQNVFLNVIIFIGILILVVSLFNVVVAGISRIEVYDDKIIIYKFGSTTIPYDNIVKINYAKKGLSKALKCGSLVIEITGMEEKSPKIEYINEVEKQVHDLLVKITHWKHRQQQQFQTQTVFPA